MEAAQAAENDRDKWDLIWYFWWGRHNSVPTWTHSENSLAAAEALSLIRPFRPVSLDQLDNFGII